MDQIVKNSRYMNGYRFKVKIMKKCINFAITILFTSMAIFITNAHAEEITSEYILNLNDKHVNRVTKRLLRNEARTRNKKNYKKWISKIQGQKLEKRLLKKALRQSISKAGFTLLRDNLPEALGNTYIVKASSQPSFSVDDLDPAKVGYLESNRIVEIAIPNLQTAAARVDVKSEEIFTAQAMQSTGNPNCSEFNDCSNDPQANWGVGPVVGIDAYKAWKISTGSSDVVVAIVDTGVDLSHPDLIQNIWSDTVTNFAAGESVHGFNAFANTPPQDDFGIGTHAAGIIGARGNNAIGIQGVNWQVGLMPVKVYRLIGGNTVQTSLDAMLRSLGYIIKKKQQGVNIKVVQSSWLASPNSTSLQTLVQQLNTLGILFVSTAGDNFQAGQNINSLTIVPATYSMPNVITIGSYYGTFTGFSSFIDYSDFANYGNTKVHLAAPGESILSTWLGGSYQFWAGSNIAAAFASGTAALIASVDNTLTPAQIKDLMINTGKPFSQFNGLTITGKAVNAGNALEAIAPPFVALSGDYNCDDRVDSADYTVWRDNLGRTNVGECSGDGDGDGDVDQTDYIIWKNNFGSSR